MAVVLMVVLVLVAAVGAAAAAAAAVAAAAALVGVAMMCRWLSRRTRWRAGTSASDNAGGCSDDNGKISRWYHGDNRLGAPPHLNLQVQNSQARHRLRTVVITTLTAHGLVSAGAERVPALAAYDDDAHVRVILRMFQASGELEHSTWTEGVVVCWSVDRNPRDPLGRYIEQYIGQRRSHLHRLPHRGRLRGGGRR